MVAEPAEPFFSAKIAGPLGPPGRGGPVSGFLCATAGVPGPGLRYQRSRCFGQK
jgi:hypothetical protein